MQKFKGRLLYMGWFNLPWKLVTDNGDIDIWPIVEKFFISISGKLADHKRERESYTLSTSESSEFRFNYIPGKEVLLEKIKGFGFSNVFAYIDDSLIWLSGRLVEIEVEDDKYVKFAADTSEKVFGVYFSGDGNSCEVPPGSEKTICKIMQHDCCIFTTASADGFHCEKFNGPIARMLLDRLAKGTIRASRIGNCTNLGRKK